MHERSGFKRLLHEGVDRVKKDSIIEIKNVNNQPMLVVNDGKNEIALPLDDQELFEVGFSIMSCAQNPECDGVVDLLEANLDGNVKAGEEFSKVMEEVAKELSPENFQDWEA